MKEFQPPRQSGEPQRPAIRIRREDVQALPLQHRDDPPAYTPTEGREWALVVLEEGETFQDWQVGRRLWVEVPQGSEIADLESHELWAVLADEAELAERAYLWRYVGLGATDVL